MTKAPRVDWITIAGVTLILMPLLTMLHEVGGHAVACLSLGHNVTELGSFYAACDAPRGIGFDKKLVAIAGPSIDAVAAVVAYLLWTRTQAGFWRLILWYVWVASGFSFAGYLAFSGILGVGDLGTGERGGIGPLSSPHIWRAAFAFVGIGIYWKLILAAKRSLSVMIGQGPETTSARRTIAFVFYAVLCVSSVLASLPNPIGMKIVLLSAIPATFGGKAGFLSIGNDTQSSGEPRALIIERNWVVLMVGLCLSLVFAALLGPSIRFSV